MTALDIIADWCASHDLEAFATGSFVRGNADARSDIDVVVLLETRERCASSHAGPIGRKQIEADITERINRETDVQPDIDVNVYGMDDLQGRIQRGDPFAMTLLNGATPLSLSPETEEWLDKLQGQSGVPDDKLTASVVRRNIKSACINVAQALLYEHYLLLAKRNRPAVPPRQLPAVIASLSDGNVDLLEQVLELKRRVEADAVQPRTALRELIDLLQQLETCGVVHCK